MKPTSAILLLPLTLLVACGGDQAQGTTPAGSAAPSGSAKAPPAPVTGRQALSQVGAFDVGTLSAAPPALAGQVNKDVLMGVELGARPLVMECLVDPKNRGPEKQTKVVIDATLSDAGVDHKVSGQNLTPAGTACITAALGKYTGQSSSLNAKNAAPGGAVTAHLEVGHTAGVSPSVILGANEASDVLGAVRLALPGWGDCLADWKAAAPRTLTGAIKLAKPKPAAPEVSPTDVTFDASGDATADKVAACLKTKILALKVKAPTEDQLTVPTLLRFVHSGIAETSLPGATPDLVFSQIDLQRGKQGAEAVVASGERILAATAYNATVDGFKLSSKDPKAPKVSVLDLKNKCQAMLAADDKLIGILQRVLAGEESAHKFAQDQKAKDPSWGEVETLTAQKVGEAQKDVENMRNNRKLDEGACPKEK